jgi:hypothetical protein
MFQHTHSKEETITKDQVKDQYIKVIFKDTGNSKTDVPGNVGIETQGLTDRHILMAAFLLLDTVYERFNQKETTLAQYMFDTFNHSDEQEKALAKNTIKSIDELLAKLKERNKKDNK